MTIYYIDPSKANGGNGLTEATAFDSISDPPNVAGNTWRFRADGLVHRTTVMPTSLTSYNIAKSIPDNTTIEAYGSGDVTFSGAVKWTAAVTVLTHNGLSCLDMPSATKVSPSWFPRANRVPAYPSICAPNGVVDGLSWLPNPEAVDNPEPGLPGYRFPPPYPAASQDDQTREVSWAGAKPNYTIYFRDLFGFWKNADNVAPLAGYHIVCRLGANFTNYQGVIDSFDPFWDAGDGGPLGRVVMSVNLPDQNVATSQNPLSGLDTGYFFYGLFAHPYGLRLQRQYAMRAGDMGWIASLPNNQLDIGAWSTIFSAITKTNIHFVSPTEDFVWRFEAVAHIANVSRGGCGVYLSGGMSNFSIGKWGARQLRNYKRDGGGIQYANSGAASSMTIGGGECLDSIGVAGLEISTGSIGGGIVCTGPYFFEECGAGLRFAGAINGISAFDVVIVGSAHVHDNAHNTYQDSRNTLFDGGCIVGQVNPHASQWQSVGSSVYGPTNRQTKNVWFSGRPNLAQTDWLTFNAIRHDNGGYGGLYERVIAVHAGQAFFGPANATVPNTGMLVDRCVFEHLGRSNSAPSFAFAGVRFRHCVFIGISGTTTLATLTAEAAEVTNCVFLGDATTDFNGVFTDEMWDRYTLKADYSGHENVSPFLAPQLNLYMPAYNTPHTIQRPALIPSPLRVGQLAKSMVAQIINVHNPRATLALPAGQGDNDKFTLYKGDMLMLAVDCPNQATMNVVVDVTSPVASDSPQRFSYPLTVGAIGNNYWASDEAPPDPPDPPDPPPTTEAGGKIRLMLHKV